MSRAAKNRAREQGQRISGQRQANNQRWNFLLEAAAAQSQPGHSHNTHETPGKSQAAQQRWGPLDIKSPEELQAYFARTSASISQKTPEPQAAQAAQELPHSTEVANSAAFRGTNSREARQGRASARSTARKRSHEAAAAAAAAAEVEALCKSTATTQQSAVAGLVEADAQSRVSRAQAAASQQPLSPGQLTAVLQRQINAAQALADAQNEALVVGAAAFHLPMPVTQARTTVAAQNRVFVAEAAAAAQQAIDRIAAQVADQDKP